MKQAAAFVCLISAFAAGATDAQDADFPLNLMSAPVVLRGSSFRGTGNFNTAYVDTTNHYNAACDGDARTWWEPMEAKGPHFIEMRWQQPVAAFEARWQFAHIDEAVLSRMRKGAWTPVATLSGAEGRIDFAVAKGERWRLDVRKVSGMPKIFELAMFGPRQYMLPAEIPNGSDPGKVTVENVVLPKGTFRPGDDVEVSFAVSAAPGTVPYGLMVELSDRAALDHQRSEGCDFCSGRWAVRPDKDGRVTLRMELPPWTPQGSNDLIVTALSDASGRQLTTKNRVLVPIVVERPGLPAMLEPARQVCVGTNAVGQRGFVINGK